jgi:hypothetical protein
MAAIFIMDMAMVAIWPVNMVMGLMVMCVIMTVVAVWAVDVTATEVTAKDAAHNGAGTHQARFNEVEFLAHGLFS